MTFILLQQNYCYMNSNIRLYSHFNISDEQNDHIGWDVTCSYSHGVTHNPSIGRQESLTGNFTHSSESAQFGESVDSGGSLMIIRTFLHVTLQELLRNKNMSIQSINNI